MNTKQARPTGDIVLPSNVGEIGFGASASIRTPRGDVPAKCLLPGEVVLTRRGPRRLQNTVQRVLKPAQRHVVIKTEAFAGYGNRELILLPEQRVLLRDWRAQILFGQDIATPPVFSLIDGENARYDVGSFLVIQLLFFNQPEVVYVNGVELASADRTQI